MQTSTEIPADKALWLSKRRKVRRAYLIFVLVIAPLFATSLWLFERDYQQWLQEAAQYQQDCSHATAASQNCQILPMQVYENRVEGFTDPDDDAHSWIGLQSKSGQKFMVDSYGPQWSRLGIDSPVAAIVWNGEVEEVRYSGGFELMATNPIRKAEEKRLSLTFLELLALGTLCIPPFALIGADKLHARQWKRRPGNNPTP